MTAEVFELQDGQYLGCIGKEIVSLPAAPENIAERMIAVERLSVQFEQLLTELHKLCNDGKAIVELFWITEKVERQAFTSRIRQFVIVRKIGMDQKRVSSDVTELAKNFGTSLDANQFATRDINLVGSEFQKLLNSVNNDCLYAITKSEHQAGNSASPFGYYYWDVIAGHNTDNFQTLVASMCQMEGCALCFQLWPVTLTLEESIIINEYGAQFARVAEGFYATPQQYIRDQSAEIPSRIYQYYSERKNSPIFQYCILAFGSQQTCNTLAIKTISLLKSGMNRLGNSDFSCINLSAERVSISRQFLSYPWNVGNKLIFQYRNKQLFRLLPLAAKLFRMPYLISAEEAAVFLRLPLHEQEMPALRRNFAGNVKEQFSQSVISDESIQFGLLYSDQTASLMVGCPPKAFTKHAMIVGMPGSGKTTFSVNLLLQFAKKGIPFLAIEPTKTEYRAMIDAVPGLTIFTPGNNAVSPFIINPFIPPKGIRIEQYIPSLNSAFAAAFSMPSPLDAIFLKAIRACYSEYGWKDYNMLGDNDVRLFGLYEFILVFKRLISNMNYSGEVRSNIESAGLLRLSNLIEQNSNIYDTIHTVPIEDLLKAPTVLELNSIDNSEQKALIMALLLINICVYTKNNQEGEGALKNVILIDEAHVLLDEGNSNSSDGKADSKGSTITALQNMIAEIRSFGTGMIIADQSPSRVGRSIVANTDIKVSFRLVQSAEKSLISDSTNMDSAAADNLSRLKPGEAYYYFSQLESPQRIVTEDIRDKKGIRLSVSNAEIAQRSTYWKTRQMQLIPFNECTYCKACEGLPCDFVLRSDADHLAEKVLTQYRRQISSIEAFKKCVFYLPKFASDHFKPYVGLDRERIIGCTKIRLIRRIQLETSLTLSEKDLSAVMQPLSSK